MRPDSYPLDGHDFVGEAEIRDLEAGNRNRLEAKFSDDAAILRAGIFEKLHIDGALSEGNGWAVYHSRQLETTGLAIQEFPTEFLLFSGYQVATGESSLRIVTNEPIVAEGKVGYLTEDFMLSGNSKAVYSVNGYRPGEIVKSPKALAPIFILSEPEGDLTTVNNFLSVPTPRHIVYLDAVNNPEKSCMPFGGNSWIEDKIYALEQGQRLFAQVLSASLAAMYKPQQ